MNIQQELDSLFENALALLKESIDEPEKQPERGERLCAWNKKFRAVGRAVTARPWPRHIREVAKQTPTRAWRTTASSQAQPRFNTP
jgi:hypothetical protein